jgi:hypothetical protein
VVFRGVPSQHPSRSSDAEKDDGGQRNKQRGAPVSLLFALVIPAEKIAGFGLKFPEVRYSRQRRFDIGFQCGYPLTYFQSPAPSADSQQIGTSGYPSHNQPLALPALVAFLAPPDHPSRKDDPEKNLHPLTRAVYDG